MIILIDQMSQVLTAQTCDQSSKHDIYFKTSVSARCWTAVKHLQLSVVLRLMDHNNKHMFFKPFWSCSDKRINFVAKRIYVFSIGSMSSRRRRQVAMTLARRRWFMKHNAGGSRWFIKLFRPGCANSSKSLSLLLVCMSLNQVNIKDFSFDKVLVLLSVTSIQWRQLQLPANYQLLLFKQSKIKIQTHDFLCECACAVFAPEQTHLENV